jgi:hypothetical protein
MNPNFFRGTILEQQAEKVLDELRANEKSSPTRASSRT